MHTTTTTRTLFYTLGLLCLATFAFTTSAQGTPGTPDGDAGQVRMNAEARQEARTERREAFEARVQDRIINLGSNVHNRLIAAHERMLNIIGRLETRIQKLKTLGVDTASAEAKLLEAKNTLAEARTELTNIGSLEYVVRGDTPKESFAIVRGHFRAGQEKIRTVHSLLRETVTLLKDAVRATGAGNGVSHAVSQSTTTE